MAPGASAPVPLWQRIVAVRHSNRPRLLRYGLALIFVLLSLLVRLPLDAVIGYQSPYIFFFPAVLAASVVGGFGPGLLATLTSAGLVLLQFSAPDTLEQPELLNGVAFSAVGVAISWFGERLRRAQFRATARTEEVLAREAHLKSILETVPDAMIVIDEAGTMNSFSAG